MAWAHHAIVDGLKKKALQALGITLAFAIAFTGMQGVEYTSTRTYILSSKKNATPVVQCSRN